MAQNDLVLKLKLDSSIGRANLAGILRGIRSTDGWTIRIAGDNADFSRYCPDAAAVIADRSADETVLSSAHGRNVPTVLIHGQRNETGRSNLGLVLTDDSAVGFAAADYLVSLGRFRTYAYVPAIGNPYWSEMRGRAFALRLRQKGHRSQSYDAAKDDVLPEWLKSLPKPAAIFCAWDRRAVDVVAVATKAKLDIPVQLSVLGADNDDLFCTVCRPQLSSVDFDAEGEGALAVKLLRTLVGKRRGHRPQTVFGKVSRIAERESTKTPPPCAKLVETALDYIDAHATDGITVRDVVAHLGVSRTLADLRFREMGIGTIGRSISEARLKILAKRIRTTRRPFAKLASECGFRNVNHAKAVFRNHFGMTMTEMRHSAT